MLGCALLALACNGDPSDGPRGAACADDRDCERLSCVADAEAAAEDLSPLALVCGTPGAGGPPRSRCEQPSDCDRGVCLLAGSCAEPCADDQACADDERCQAVFARNAADALQSLSACVRRVDLPDSVSVQSQVQSAALEPPVTEIELAAAEEAGATLYVLERLTDTWPDGERCRTLCPRSLYTRDDAPVELFSADADYAIDAAPLNPVATGDHVHPSVVMLPIGSADVLSPAGYALELEVEQADELRVTRLSGATSGRRLDLNAFYVGARDLQPEGDRGPPLIADALAVVDEILAQADISVGELRQIDVPGELPLRGTAFPDGDGMQGFAELQLRFGVYVELPGLFRLSAGAGNPAVNLFFVRDIAPRSADGEPEAEAGGIPGPLGMHGTGASGIAIATDMMAGEPQMLGRTLAHEIAHYLGLFHTSEADGSVYDPLDDTPECRPEQDRDGDRLSVADCQDHGADNLMFWAKTSGTLLTPQQIAVLQRALILQ